MTRTSLTESIIQYVEQEAALLVFTLDSSGRILNANRYAERLVGKELPQKKLSDVVVDFTGSVKLPDLINEPERVHLINIETAGGLPQTFYFRFLRAGSEILAIGELNSLELENLRKELVTANNELSNLGREFQKKNAELAKLNDLNKQLLGVVRTSEERYRLVVENANEAVAVAQDDMFKFVNRMACEITGFSEGELLSRPFVDIIHRDDRSMV
ncbi:MAG: PAS domain S-box protein, partial [Syntrophobacteraceae bacterium]